MTDHSPILDLDLIAPKRETIRLRWSQHPEGKLYELASADDLSIEDQAWLARRGEQVQAMSLAMSDRALSESDASDLSLAVDDLVARALIGLEPEALAEMRLTAKWRVIEVFTQRLPLEATSEIKQSVEQMQETGKVAST